jgi:hypothetical protein
LQPYELFIGLRYTRAKRRNHFISFISMLGMALGVMVRGFGVLHYDISIRKIWDTFSRYDRSTLARRPLLPFRLRIIQRPLFTCKRPFNFSYVNCG